jgi:hypothetical protein
MPGNGPVVLTPEMRQALAEAECEVEGHDHEYIMTVGNPGPVLVFCGRCWRQWNPSDSTGEDSL